MSVDLKPKNKRVPYYHSGSFSWGWMAERGVFLSVGCASVAPGNHMLVDHFREETSIHYNDGFPVSAHEAKAMAWAAYGLWLVESAKLRWWAELTQEERDRREGLAYGERGKNDWTPIREDFVEKALAFAWFAYASGGFRVH